VESCVPLFWTQFTHEFRTPLTAIKASATSLLSDANLDSAQQHELITVIDEETDRLNHLVGEAAEMARLDSNQVELQREPIISARPLSGQLRKPDNLLQTTLFRSISVIHLPLVSIDLERSRTLFVSCWKMPANIRRPDLRFKSRLRQTPCAYCQRCRPRSGIDDFEQSLIFDKFSGARMSDIGAREPSMGLAIAKAVVEAPSGTFV